MLFFILLVISGFFSGSETAFFAIDQVTQEKLSASSKRSAKRVLRLLAHPRRLLITILIGNTLVNVTAASLAAIITTRLCDRAGFNRELGVFINVIVVTFLILVLSEITPKIFAVKNSERFALSVSLLIKTIYILLIPFVFLIDRSIDPLTRIFRVKESQEERLLHMSEFKDLLDLGEEQGELEQEEKEMIHSIFEFGDTTVREIMIPRTDVVCVAHDAGLDEVIGLIKTKGHTRLPVYRESIDNIQGIVNAKDLLPFVSNAETSFEALKLARPTIFVPEGKKIDELLRLFQKERQHMAIVVDEYGGTSGIVTLEDVIEEIVGEIRDEYDQEPTLFREINEGTVLVNAKIDVESLNKLINIDIPIRDEYDTLGGFILELTGSVPEEKDPIQFNDYELIMEKVEKNRIILVKIIHSPAEAEQ